ncbi:MAG: periplasmic heavy metal sensor [Syntrophaceae bacterium]
MKKAIMIGLCLTLALALIGTAALAWGTGFGRGFGMGPGFGYPAISNLTAEQSAQIKALQEAFLKENEPILKEIRTKQMEIFGLQSKLHAKGNSLRAEVGKVLTPEQQAQLPAFNPGQGFGPDRGFVPPMMRLWGRW